MIVREYKKNGSIATAFEGTPIFRLYDPEYGPALTNGAMYLLCKSSMFMATERQINRPKDTE